MSATEIALLVALLGCVVGAAFLSLAEVAIVRVRRSDIVITEYREGVRSDRLLHLLDDLPVVLNSILLMVLLFQVGAATIGGFLADRWFGGFGVTIATIVVTMLLFVYAEAIPKTIAVRSPHQVALRVLPILEWVVALLRPFVRALIRLADLQSPGPPTSPGALKEEEIRALTRESAAAGEITSGDAALVDRSFEFNDCQVGDVMVAREQIGAITAEQSVREAAAQAISLGHRRLLVYRDDLDDVVGVVRLRDVAAAAIDNPSAAAATVATEVLRCQADYLISMLMRDMQRSGKRLAIVTEPDGRTVGLVTIEDLVAELVGEIADDGPTDSAADD